MAGVRLLLTCALASGALVACNDVLGIRQLPGTEDAGVPDGGALDAAAGGARPPSCAPSGQGMTTCGDGGDDCCATLPIPAGAYLRTYEYSEDGGIGDSGADPATVSGFRLDKYEVTVGRYRQFLAAWNANRAMPDAGSGKHAHLNGGKGLVSAVDPSTFEPGWRPDDNGKVAPGANLTCDNAATWADVPAGNENLPMSCVNWYAAYAFCIWDGGFLPSEAEWEYAAAGGSEQRKYAWGSTEPDADCSRAIWNCYYPSHARDCAGTPNIAPVGTAALGVGLWGQLDLTGNVYEWTLDKHAGYVSPCQDCAYFAPGPDTLFRGGSMYDTSDHLLPTGRYYGPADKPQGNVGFRCARAP